MYPHTLSLLIDPGVLLCKVLINAHTCSRYFPWPDGADPERHPQKRSTISILTKYQRRRSGNKVKNKSRYCPTKGPEQILMQFWCPYMAFVSALCFFVTDLWTTKVNRRAYSVSQLRKLSFLGSKHLSHALGFPLQRRAPVCFRRVALITQSSRIMV